LTLYAKLFDFFFIGRWGLRGTFSQHFNPVPALIKRVVTVSHAENVDTGLRLPRVIGPDTQREAGLFFETCVDEQRCALVGRGWDIHQAAPDRELGRRLL
jgi:hypothetical protein